MHCTLMPPHRDGYCDWDGVQLTGKRRRWCSDGCMREYRRQHDWDTAREAALVRDGYRCQNCGVQTAGSFEGDWEDLPSAPQRPRWEEFDDKAAFQEAVEQWAKAWKLFVSRVVKPMMPEVNHIEPLVGKGYAWSCSHHAVNLQTLCHSCHVQETKRQRVQRRLENARKVYEEEISGRRSSDRTRSPDGTAAGAHVGVAVVGAGEAGVGDDPSGLAGGR